MGFEFKGRKTSSSTSRKATRHDDSLFGQDTVEIILALGEGPMDGLVDGAASFEVGDVPLLDKGSQTPNISNFELRFLKGTNPADTIKPNLGGLASTKNIGLELRTLNQSVVAQGDKSQIDFIDIRMIVSRLLAVSAEGGEFPNDVQFKVEVKPRSSAVWQIPFDNQPPPPVENTSGASNYRPGTTTPGTLINEAYRETYIQATAPTGAKNPGAMWFDTTKQWWEPQIWSGTAWVYPNGRHAENRFGFVVWVWNDLDGTVRAAWYSPDGIAPPPGTLTAGDFLLTPNSGTTVYSYNETSWVAFQNWNQVQQASPGVITINGLARSTYPKEYRIPVARINEPYDVRLTRLSPQSTKDVFRDITFESIQEVIANTFSFPDLALIWLTIKATDTFTSIPEFTGVYRGIVIPVPTNYTYNPITKLGEYTGIWDGAYKLAYTNSPSWHAFNLINNSRYGKNSYFPEVPDKWDYYEFAKHCDLHGFRFNEYISEPRSINEMINYMVGIAGGRYVDRGDGYSTVIWDADDQVAVALFTPENVIDGSFTYSFTDITERKNDFKVSFKNPELNYREDRVRVWDQNTIDVLGRNAEEFVAVGCRDPKEAVKRGRLRLATALTEKTICNFKTTRLGRYLLPFQVILVADPLSQQVLSGRIMNPDLLPAGSTNLPLRDQIYLEAGIAYSVTFTVSNGNGGTKLVSYPLSVASGGQQTRLTLATALSEPLSEYAVFSIGTPKAYRITSINADDNNPDLIDLTVIEVNRQKWAFVDGLIELRDILATQTGPLSKFVYPVSNAQIVPETTLDGHFNLVVKWNASETKLIRGYRVYQSLNSQPMQLIAETNDLTARISDALASTYFVTITALGLDGTTESAPVTVQYIVANAGSLRSTGQPSNLRLVDEPEAPLFRAVDPKFIWDAAADPLVSKYEVSVLNGSGQTVHSERVEGNLVFVYSLLTNRTENGNPLRQFTVQVRSIDSTGSFSLPVSLVVSHPAPPVVSFTLDAVSETVFVQYTPPAGDWQGTLIWMETIQGFNPLTTSPKYDGSNSFVPLPAKKDTRYYIRLAAYDSYSKTGLNISDEKSIFTSLKLFDTNGPNQPTGLTLTTAPVLLADGTVMASITATWDAPLASDTAYGQPEIEFGEGVEPGVSFLADRVPAAQRTWTRGGFRPGITYSVRLRYRPNATSIGLGPYTVVKTIVAALNLTPPGNPTNVVVTAGFGLNTITLTAPSNKDLKWIEVWAVAGNNASAVPAGATLLGTIPVGSSQFFDYAVSGGQKTYWFRSVNTSDIPATSYVRVVSAVSPQILAAQIAAGIIDDTKLATSLSVNVPKPVDALTATKTSNIVLYQGQLYRWDDAKGAYTNAVPAIAVGAGLTDAQIASLNATKIAGTLTDAQLAGISSTKLIGSIVDSQLAAISAAKITGQVTDAQIAALAATKVSGQLTDAQLAGISSAKLVGAIVAAQIASVNANAVQGQITAAQIASLNATQIAGQLSNAQLSGIDSAKLIGSIVDSQLAGISSTKLIGSIVDSQLAAISATKVTGQLTAGQISSVNAAAVAGQLTDAQLAAISSTKLVGAIVDSQIAAIAAGKVTGQLTAAQIASVNAAAIAGLITSTQITDGSISTPKLAAGAVVASKIAAQSIVASKLAIASSNMAFNPDASQGTLGWDRNGGPMPGNIGFGLGTRSQWAPDGFLPIYMNSDIQANSTGYTDIRQRPIKPDATETTYPVNAGLWYEFSVCLSAHRCDGLMYVGWINAAGATIVYSQGSIISQQAVSGGTVPTFPRSTIIAQAPANAVGCNFLFRMQNSVGPNPHIFCSALMMALAPLGAATTEVSTYVAPGMTTIDGGQLLTDTIGARQIISGSVTAVEIAARTIVASNLVAGTITTTEIAASTITGNNIVGRTISAGHIVAGTITAGEIAARSITAANLAAGTITAYEILANTITTSQIAVRTLVAANMAAGAITAYEIAASTITASQIAGRTITAGQIATGTLTANELAANSVTAGKIDAGAITAREIAAGSILTEKLTIANRQLSLLGFNWRMTGSSGVIQWDDGLIFWKDKFGNGAGVSIPAGSFIRSGAAWYGIHWQEGTSALIINTDVNYAIGRTDVLTLVTYDNSYAGLDVKYGATIIDGDRILVNTINASRIIARTITAGQISAGAITAYEIAATTIVAGNIAANAIVAGKIDAGAVSAREIVAGSVTASKLAITSLNRTFNSDLSQDLIGWFKSFNNTGVGTVFGLDDTYTPGGMRGVQLYLRSGIATSAGGAFDLQNAPIDPNNNIGYYSIAGNQLYELSAYVSAHRCRVYICLCTWDANMANYSEQYGTVSISDQGYSKNTSTSAWNATGRVRFLGRTPGGAAFAQIKFRAQDWTAGAASAAPYMFVSGCMFAPALDGQTETSPYTPVGATTINGGQVLTDSIGSRQIIAQAITAEKISVKTITAAQIASGSLTADVIGANAITAGKIDAGAISAREIVAGAVTADKIFARTIKGDHLEARTIYGDLIAANTIQAGSLIANSITAGQISAGAIGVNQLAAGAITADKIGVGLNAGNLIWNADFSLDYGTPSAFTNEPNTTFETYRDTSWSVYGWAARAAHCTGNPRVGYVIILPLSYPTADGSSTIYMPVVPLARYEFSAYISAHRSNCYFQLVFVDGNNSEISSVNGNIIAGTQKSGGPSDDWRSRGFATAPGNATGVYLRGVANFTGEADPFIFLSCPYFGLAQPNQTQHSTFAPQSRTVIAGGQIATNSLSADKIIAGSITTDKLQAGSINADRLELTTLKTRVLAAGAVTADTIRVGNGNLSTLLSGDNSTKIDGYAISANSILANRLQVGNRGLNIVGLNFRYVAATRQILWDAGAIYYTNNDGGSAGVNIPAGGFTVSGANYYCVYWIQGKAGLDYSTEINISLSNLNAVTMCTYDNAYSGLAVNYGSTIIDGDQIIAGSIKANRIAANEIQTYHMSANSIQGDRIVAGTLSADKISAGNISAGNISIGGGRMIIETANDRARMYGRDSNGTLRYMMGYTGDFTGQGGNLGYGLLLWDVNGNQTFNASGAVTQFLQGQIQNAQIADAAITNAKIGNLEVTNIKIGNGEVNGIKIADLSATQVVASAASGPDTGDVGINIRGTGKVVITGYFMANSTQASAQGPGDLIIYRDGNEVLRVASNFWTTSGGGNVSYYYNSMAIVLIDTPGGGYHNYRVFSSNGGRLGKCTVVIQECAK